MRSACRPSFPVATQRLTSRAEWLSRRSGLRLRGMASAQVIPRSGQAGARQAEAIEYVEVGRLVSCSTAVCRRNEWDWAS